MTPHRPPRPTSTSPRAPQRAPQRVFGDWRIPPGSPEERELQQRGGSLSMWRQASIRLNQLENAASYGALWRQQQHRFNRHNHHHSVNVTHATGHDTLTPLDDPPIEHIHGVKKIIRRLIAVFLLLPLSITMVYALALQLYHALPTTAADVGFWLSDPIYFAILGITTYAALIITRVATPQLVYFYVLGHELTHALAALTCFGKICAVSVDTSGGYIETDKDNTYIALAPYFIPLWMLVWVLMAWVAGFFFTPESVAPWFFAGVGFWWSFHIYWTIWVIPREQPDLLENGVTFSLLVVIITNIAGLVLLLRFFNFISLRGYWQDFLTCAGKLGETLSWLFGLCFN